MRRPARRWLRAAWCLASCFAVLCLWAAHGMPAQRAGSTERPTILGPGTTGASFDCGVFEAAVLDGTEVSRTVCPLAIVGGPAFATDQIRGDNLLAAFDRNGAMIAVHEPTANVTSLFRGSIDHVGQQDDVIHWGLWRTGKVETFPSKRSYARDESTGVPYIVGVSTHSIAVVDRSTRRLHRLFDLPGEGTANYSLAGDAGVVSRKDNFGNAVAVGQVQSANATIDFKNRTGQLHLSVAVRGTVAMIDFPLVAADQIMGFNAGAVSKDTPCRRPAPEEYCPVAEMQFFGRDGQFLGIFFSYGHNTVLPEAASVAAHLNNVLAQGAVVLKRN